jgi:hypothetical protein
MYQSQKIIFSLVLILSTLTGALTAYEHPSFEIEVRQWSAELDSEVRLIKNNIGRTLDVDETLGVKDEDVTEGIFTFHTGEQSKVRFSYFTSEFDGSQNLVEQVQFQGNTYTLGTTVNTEMDIAYGRLGWIYYFDEPTAVLRGGFIFELKVIDFDIALEVPALPSLNQTESAVGGLPTIGFALEFRPVDNVLIYAEASGISDGGTYGHFLEAEAGLKLNYEFFSLSAGYRMLELKVEDDLNFFDLELSGVFVSAHFQF